MYPVGRSNDQKSCLSRLRQEELLTHVIDIDKENWQAIAGLATLALEDGRYERYVCAPPSLDSSTNQEVDDACVVYLTWSCLLLVLISFSVRRLRAYQLYTKAVNVSASGDKDVLMGKGLAEYRLGLLDQVKERK